MKVIFLFIAFLACYPLHAQEDERWVQAIARAEQDTERYIRERIEAGWWYKGEDTLHVMLVRDTMRIEQAVRYFSEQVKTTADMRPMNHFLLDEYDKLLNKYYNRLRGKLSPAQREALLKAQREWLKFRDVEGDFIYKLIIDNYGRMGPVLIGSDCVELLKNRVFQLYSYLQYMD